MKTKTETEPKLRLGATTVARVINKLFRLNIIAYIARAHTFYWGRFSKQKSSLQALLSSPLPPSQTCK